MGPHNRHKVRGVPSLCASMDTSLPSRPATRWAGVAGRDARRLRPSGMSPRCKWLSRNGMDAYQGRGRVDTMATDFIRMTAGCTRLANGTTDGSMRMLSAVMMSVAGPVMAQELGSAGSPGSFPRRARARMRTGMWHWAGQSQPTHPQGVAKPQACETCIDRVV